MGGQAGQSNCVRQCKAGRDHEMQIPAMCGALRARERIKNVLETRIGSTVGLQKYEPSAADPMAYNACLLANYSDDNCRILMQVLSAADLSLKGRGD